MKTDKKLALLQSSTLALRELLIAMEPPTDPGSAAGMAYDAALQCLTVIGWSIEPLLHREYSIAEIKRLNAGYFFSAPRKERLRCKYNFVFTTSSRPGVGVVVWGFNTKTRRMDLIGDAPSFDRALWACGKIGLYGTDMVGAAMVLRRLLDGTA